MAWRFFKKGEPSNIPILGNGARVIFATLDTIVGYYATDNPYVQSEFDRMAAERRGGITEITEAEFHTNYVQKKTTAKTVQPPWREELSKSQVNRSLLHQLGPEHVAAAVAVNEEKLPAMVAIPTPEAKGENYKPTVGRRPPKRT